LAYLRVPVEDARQPPAHPRARARGGGRIPGAVVGRNPGDWGRGRALACRRALSVRRQPEGLALPQGKGAGSWGRWKRGQEGREASESRSEGIRRPIVSAARIVWSRICHDDQKSLKEGEQ
jgi:hypothetical protein